MVGGEVGELNTLACFSKSSRAAIVFTSNWGELLYVIVYIQLGGSVGLFRETLVLNAADRPKKEFNLEQFSPTLVCSCI